MARRRAAFLNTIVVLALILLGVTAVASPAQARGRAAAAPAVSVANPLPGEVFVLSGALGRSLRRQVRLQTSHGGRWVTAKRTVIPRSGRYRFHVRQSSPTQSWRVMAGARRKHGHTFPARVSAARTITLTTGRGRLTSPETVTAGDPVALSASFVPRRPGRTVRFQIRQGATWVDLASSAQGSGGRARVLWTAPGRGIQQLRALADAGRGASPLTTPVVRVYVLPASPVAVSAHASNSWNDLDAALAQRPDWIETDFKASAVNPRAISPQEDPTCAGPQGTRFWFLTHDDTFAEDTDVARVFPTRADDLTGTFTCSEIKQFRLRRGSPAHPDVHGPLTLAEFAAAVRTFEARYAYSTERILLEFKESDASLFADFYDQVKAAAPDWIDAGSHRDRAVFISFAYRSAFAPLLDPDWSDDATHAAAAQERPVRVDDGAELGAVMNSASAPLPSVPAGVATHWLQAHYAFGALSPTVTARARTVFDQVVAWTPATTAEVRSSVSAGADVVTVDDVMMARRALAR